MRIAIAIAPETTNPPRYWMDETSGILADAVFAYLYGQELNPVHISYLRAYVRQWIFSPAWDQNPHAGATERAALAEMRADIDGLTSREALKSWLTRAVEFGVDPL